MLSIGVLWLSTSSPVAASANNDSFDGNIFALYAGNGSLVPPKQTIAESIAQGRPSMLVLYLEDSKDCKLFASKVSRFQGLYGRYTSIIPVNIDSLPLEGSGDPTDPATYNDQLVPKTVLFDRDGTLVLNVTGNVPFETIDDKFREIFDLLPRDESEELIRREPLNEINTELSQ
ncbi:MAG: thioredoxin family protein [Oscillatoriales cyanobacterium]|nr:MAG: thioredoxin family protein [Oscillatoriales cyanobacterium]